MAKGMIEITINPTMKQKALKFCLLILFIGLTSCGTPHSVSLSQKAFSITGSHSVGAFNIKRVQLDIKGFKSLTIKKNEGIEPRAIIKYEGTGIFQAQWLVDGQLVKQEQVLLNRGSLLTLNPKLNSIATSQYGRHVIQLNIKQPNVSFKTPEITVFVTQ